MATYNLSELINFLKDFQRDGIRYVDISETDPDEGEEGYECSLCVETIVDDSDIGTEDFFDSCDVDYDNLYTKSSKPNLSFSDEELSIIYNAIKQASEFYRADIASYKKDADACQKLKTKITKHLH